MDNSRLRFRLPSPIWMSMVVAITSLATATAFADDGAAKALARSRLAEGAQRLAAGDNTGALSDFEEAYRLFPSPKIQFDIGLANFRLGRNPLAYRAFQRFLSSATDAAPEAVTGARARLNLLRPKIATVAIVCPRAGLEIDVDDATVGRTPLPEPVYLDPGPHRVATKVSAGNPTLVTKSFTVEEGEEVSIELSTERPIARPVALAMAAPDVGPRSVTSSSGRVETSSPALLVGKPAPFDEPAPSASTSRPLYRRPWFWAAGAGVAAAVGLTLWLTLGHSASDPMASLGRVNLPGQP